MELRYENLSINRYVANETAKIQNALIGWYHRGGEGGQKLRKPILKGQAFL
jgi:hypothetical protein